MRRNRFDQRSRQNTTSGYVASNSWKNSTRFTGKCFQCGTVGHRAQFCNVVKAPNQKAVRPLSSALVCFNCGSRGHKAAECRLSAGRRLSNMVKCWTCGQSGHKSVVCPSLRQQHRVQGSGDVRRAYNQSKAPQARRSFVRHEAVEKRADLAFDHIPKALGDVEPELKEFVRCLNIKYMVEVRRQRIWLAFDKAVERIPEYNYTAYDRVLKQSEAIELCAKLEGVQNAGEELRMVKLEALQKEAANAKLFVDKSYDGAKAKAVDKPWGKLLEEFCQWKDLQARDESEVALLKVWSERERWVKLVAEKKERAKAAKESGGVRAESPPRDVKEARSASGVDESALSKRVTTESAWLSKKIGERATKVAEVKAALSGRVGAVDFAPAQEQAVGGVGQGAFFTAQTD